MSQCPVLDRCPSEGRASKIAISNVSRVFNHIFQSARQGARSVKYVTVSGRLYERRCRRRRGWSVVKGRSDIYTRPLPLVHSVGCYMVSWWNTETPNIHAFLFLSFLSCFPFFPSFALSPSAFLLSSCPFRLRLSSLFPLALYHFIPFSRIVQFISIFLRCPLPPPRPSLATSGIAFSSTAGRG